MSVRFIQREIYFAFAYLLNQECPNEGAMLCDCLGPLEWPDLQMDKQSAYIQSICHKLLGAYTVFPGSVPTIYMQFYVLMYSPVLVFKYTSPK